MSEPDLARLVAEARLAWRESRRRPVRVVLGLFVLISAGILVAPVREGDSGASLTTGASARTSGTEEENAMRIGIGIGIGLASAAIASVPAPAGELLVNGNFETVVSQNCGWVCIPAGSSNLAGWSVVQNTVDRQRTIPPTCMPEGWLAYDGQFSVDLNGCSTAGAIQQTVSVSPGAVHRLRFALTVNPGANGIPTEGRLRVSINQSSFEFIAPRTSAALQTWTVHAVTFTPTTGSVTIRFTSLNNESPNSWAGPVVDAISLTEICTTDVVQNGIIDAIDLAAVLSSWGTDGGKYPRADVDGSGFVDALDLAEVLSAWGPCP